MADLFNPATLPYLLTALGMIVLAVWLMWLDAGSRTNQVFALLLVFRGTSFALGAMLIAYRPDPLAIAAYSFGSYVIVPLLPLIIYFLSIYPRRRGVFGTTRWGPWALAAATVAFELWYAIDHGAYGILTFVGGVPQRTLGPLIFFTGIRLPAFGVAALILARDYAKQPHGSAGFSLFLVAAGFALNAIVDGILNIGLFISAVQAGVDWFPYQWMFVALPLLVVPFGFGSLYSFKATLTRERHDARLNEPRRFLLYLVPLAILSATFAAVLAYRGVLWGIHDFIHGFWRLLVPFLITYALLRYSLFDIDIRMKAGVRRGVVLGAFAVTFFVVSEAAEALISEGHDRWYGFGAAVLLALASQPLQRGARRAADALMPDTKPIEEMTAVERQRMYHEQYLLVEHDGVLTAKERRMMDRLAEALGLEDMEAARLETRGIDLDVDERGATRVEETAATATRGRRAYRSLVLATMTALVFAAIGSFFELLVPVDDFTAGLAAAGAISLLLGPLENLAGRLTRPHRAGEAARGDLELYQTALREALVDGHWSRKERTYLQSLAERLGIDRRTRRGLDRRALDERGLR